MFAEIALNLFVRQLNDIDYTKLDRSGGNPLELIIFAADFLVIVNKAALMFSFFVP